jgi:20S proteasome alpha/beta subunit
MVEGTCIVAARYRNGVIVGSDSRGMVGTVQNDGIQKVFSLCDGKIAAAFVGASGVFDEVRRKLEKDPAFRQVTDLGSAVDLMKVIVNQVCKTQLQNESFVKELFYFEIIVAGLENLIAGNPAMYYITQTGYSDPIPQECEVPYYSTGHGRHYASSLMKLFYRPDIGKDQMTELISYVLHQTALIDTAVGGKPQIVIVEPETLPILLQHDEINDIVNRVAGLSSTINQILRGLFQEKELYKVIDNYVLTDLGGIVKDNRKFEIWLKPEKKFECDLVLAEELTEYDARNDSEIKTDLFSLEGEIGRVTTGDVTIPEPLKSRGIPEDPTEIWDLLRKEPPTGVPTGLRIDNRDVNPVVKVDFKNREDHAKGVSYTVDANETIGPFETRKAVQSTKILLDVHDYILKKFGSYGKNVEVIVHKPENLQVHLVWFVTAVGKRQGGVTLNPPKIKDDCYSRKCDGVTIPGNGFAVMWWPKHRYDPHTLAK